MPPKLSRLYSHVMHYLTVGFCFAVGFMSAAVSAKEDDPITGAVSIAIAAILIGIGFRLHNGPHFLDGDEGYEPGTGVIEVPEGVIPIHRAPVISDDSWLADPKFENFRRAYGYAATQTYAIPVLAKLSPEEVYNLTSALNYGGYNWKPDGVV